MKSFAALAFLTVSAAAAKHAFSIDDPGIAVATAVFTFGSFLWTMTEAVK